MKKIFATAILLAAIFSACSGGDGSFNPPTGLTATIGNNGGELVISWTASDGAISYNLYYGTSPGVTTTTGTKITGATSPYAHTGLTNGTRYYYIATAVSGTSESAASTEANGLPQINPIGVLDTTGMPPDGYVEDTINGWANGVVVDDDGRIVMVAQRSAGLVSDMALWRFNVDGTLDNSFGGGDGLVTMNGTAGGTSDGGTGVVIDSSGRMLVVGHSQNALSKSQMVIWRFDGDGNLDTSFNSSGYVIYDRGFNGYNEGCGIMIDANGRILVTGASDNATDTDMALWRYTEVGALDPTFGGSGVVFYNNSAVVNSYDVGLRLAINADGGIAVVGESENATNTDFLIWRFTDAGTLDTSFNGDGIAVFDQGGEDLGFGVVFDAQQRVLAAGKSDNLSNGDFVILRYTAAGDLDTSFNGGGIAIYDSLFDDSGYDIQIDSRQRPVATGYSGALHNAKDMAVIRLNGDGSFDATFGNNGVALFQYQPDTRNEAGAITFDASGMIVVAGNIQPAVDMYSTLWRYE